MGLFDSFRANHRRNDAAGLLYAAAVEQARHPKFFTDWGVPDTVDGRFDMIILHTMLLIRRARGNGKVAAEVCQALLNLLFADMDRNLREMGIGDLSVGKHVKKMAKAFYGRAETWETGMDSGVEQLRQNLADTVYRAVTPVDDHLAALADYVMAQDSHLAAHDIDGFLTGAPDFVAPSRTEPAA